MIATLTKDSAKGLPLEFLRQNDERLSSLVEEIVGILLEILRFEERSTARLRDLHNAYEASSRNLLHYIAMRQSRIPELQQELASLGLSSLGRSESHVVASITSVLRLLCSITRQTVSLGMISRRHVGYREGHALLDVHTESLLGPRPQHRRVRIMVTLPDEAAENYGLVRELFRSGMDCARINCAHGNSTVWGRIIENVRAAEREFGRQCRILMDLAGPKIRTGNLPQSLSVIKISPRRDALGRVIKPALVFFTPPLRGRPPAGMVVVPVDEAWPVTVKKNHGIICRDARGRLRRFKVKKRSGRGIVAETDRTVYLVPATKLYTRAGGLRGKAANAVGSLPLVESSILLRKGDLLLITAEQRSGTFQEIDTRGRLTAPAVISCTLPEILRDLKKGERVWLDDGKIGGVIESCDGTVARVRITQAKYGGSRLRADKGMNFPDSTLHIAGLTPKDIEDLAFISRHADMAALSFLRSPQDLETLRAHLRRLGCNTIGIVLKIETRTALEQLPSLLLAAMASYPVGVMIARGDLAVEIGFDNLAEAQEDILWFCEAAHVPVIWATQVLENLAKKGLPSRAEISDAAMGVRAECVMLNKGPYIHQALRMLDLILRRMERRREKKTAV